MYDAIIVGDGFAGDERSDAPDPERLWVWLVDKATFPAEHAAALCGAARQSGSHEPVLFGGARLASAPGVHESGEPRSDHGE